MLEKMINNFRKPILFLLILTLVVNSFQYDVKPDDLKNLEKALHESSLYMSKEVKDEHVAICIGGTRAGKSTLINYLIGNELKAERLSRLLPSTISKVNSSSLGPEIGVGTTSKTTIPTKWVSKNLTNLALWDAPGFDDNRGSIQDITNAFYLHQLLQKVKSLKIILVVDINDILNDNIKPFLSVLSAVEGLLKNKMKNCFKSIAVIFTKVPDFLYEETVDKHYINEKLKQQFLSSPNMSISDASENFVTFLTENNNHIGLFKRARVGPVTSAVEVDIFSSIKMSKPIEKSALKDVSPSVSDSSKVFLFESREKLLSVTAFSDLEKIVGEVCIKKAIALEAANEKKEEEKEKNIKTLYTHLTKIQNQIFRALLETDDFQEKLIILREIDNSIGRYIEEKNLLEKIKLMEFVDNLLELQESKQLSYQLEAVLLSSLSRVKEATLTAQLKLGEITQKKHDEELASERKIHDEQMQELQKQLQEVIAQNKKRKGFFATLGETLKNLFTFHFFSD